MSNISKEAGRIKVATVPALTDIMFALPFPLPPGLLYHIISFSSAETEQVTVR